MRILAIIGARKNGNTSHTFREMSQQMQAIGDVDIEYLYLHDFELEYCRGCLFDGILLRGISQSENFYSDRKA